MNSTGILILAAGNSSRLGRPKQLLPYRGKTLLSHVVAAALGADLQPVVVVTGAYHTEIQRALADEAVNFVLNPYWETGMASGIAAGLDKALAIQPHLQSVIVAVCDQPFISADIFRILMDARSVSGKSLIACQYSGTTGTPVLFDRRHFDELSRLSGNAGAKYLLNLYKDDVATVPFPEGSIDIDTEDDFRRLPGPK